MNARSVASMNTGLFRTPPDPKHRFDDAMLDRDQGVMRAAGFFGRDWTIGNGDCTFEDTLQP